MTKRTSDSLAILPTYNEADNIGRLLKQILELSDIDVLVVDDSSPDGTAKMVMQRAASEERVHLLSRPRKEGLAAAYIAGFSWGMAQGYSHLIEMDADFSHNPIDLPRFLEAIKTHDVVVGCRYIQGGGISGWPWARKFISHAGNIYAQTVLCLPYKDLTGGFNAWRKQVLETIQIESIRSKGYAFQVELKYRAHKAGYRIQEIPIHFQNRVSGRSKMSGSIVWEAAFRVFQMRTAP